MQVPFVDLRSQFRQIRKEVLSAVETVCADAAFVLGPDVEAFEKEFASFCGARFCASLNSGTSSLHVALKAVGLKKEAGVIVPAMTFIATSAMVSLSGATPIFADIDPNTYCIDPNRVEELLTSDRCTLTFPVGAILPVHLYGQPAHMGRILEIADKYGLGVIEDCSQAHGSTWNGKGVGGFGRAGCFSFYPAKNLGAYGEGGALVTNDEKIYEFARAMRDHGSHQKYLHLFEGHNYRLDTIQAAVLRIKLKHLKNWIEKRREIAKWYRELLSNVDQIVLPFEKDGETHVYHLFVILTPVRDRMKTFLAEKGVGTGIHYPFPLHLQPAYSHLGYKEGAFPVAERVARECLSLPMYPELTQNQVSYVCRVIKEFFSSGS